MDAQTISLLISVFLGLFVGVLSYTLFVSKRHGEFSPNNTEERKGNPALLATTLLGRELYTALPETGFRKNSKRRSSIQKLLIASGNPWGLDAEEFAFIRYVTAFIGLLAGSSAFFFMKAAGLSLPWYVLIPGATIFGFFVPLIVHKEKTAERDLDFKRYLPEALDLMVISLSAGRTLNQAFRDSIDNIRPGILRDEFVKVVNSLDSGRTMVDSLNDFANRAPSDGIITFVRAVQEAEELNVQMRDILSARAEASREELFSLIHQRAQALPVKMNAVLASTLPLSLLMIIVAPVVVTLMDVL